MPFVHDYLNWASYKEKSAEVQIFQQAMFLVRTQLFCAIKVDSWKKKGGIASSLPGQNTEVRGAYARENKDRSGKIVEKFSKFDNAARRHWKSSDYGLILCHNVNS